MSLDTKRFATQKNTKTQHEPVPQWPDYDVPRKLDAKDYVAPVFHEYSKNVELFLYDLSILEWWPSNFEQS